MTVFQGITRLVAEGFRGATSRLELAFDPARPFVLIFGENGTGKSTLVDAIEFALHGSKGSLGDLSSTEIRHLASLGTPTSPLRVELHAGGNVWRAGLRGSRPDLSGPPHQPRVEILRRPRLARIVAATPGERYKELASFVDVAPVEAAERSLDAALKEAGRALDESARRLEDAQAKLETAWEEAGRPGASARAWATASQTDATAGRRLDWLESAMRALERVKNARAQAVRSDDEAAAAEAALAKLGSARSSSSEGGDAALVSLLGMARDVVGKARELTTCPVCQQPVDHGSLSADLEARLATLRDETERLAAWQRADADLKTRQAIAASHARALEEAWSGFRAVVEEPPGGLDSELLGKIRALASPATTSGAGPEHGAGSLDAALQNLHDQREAQRRAEAERVEPLRLLEEIDRREADGQRRDKQRVRLQRALEIVRTTRQEFTDRLLGEVEGEVNRLYEQLHPGEGLGSVRLRLDPNRRASLLQTATWGDVTDLAPQACFSESHLLTLAICLWLALAKRDRPDETILVLDDIVFAVDAPHTRRLAALLAAEAESFAQVLVTTHSRRFLRELRGGGAAAAKLDCRALRWTLAGGIVHGASPHDAERLAAALAEPIPEREDVASRAGRLLEALLRQLAILYRRRVPFDEPTEPTLGDLFSSWSQRDADRVRVERLVEDQWQDARAFGTILRSLRENRHVRNLVGAHVNREGDDVPDAEVLAFGRDVHALWSLVICGPCGQIPIKPRDDSFVCHCRQTRMRPNRLD